MGKKLTFFGILTALALALSFAERFIPLGLLIPLPGVKLGLANLVTVAAIYCFNAKSAFCIVLARCVLGAVFSGNVSALLYSLAGALLSWAVMSLLAKTRFLSAYGICVLGAAFHSLGQIIAASALVGASVFAYLPYLLLISILTGSITGIVSSQLLKRLPDASVNH